MAGPKFFPELISKQSQKDVVSIWDVWYRILIHLMSENIALQKETTLIRILDQYGWHCGTVLRDILQRFMHSVKFVPKNTTCSS